MFQPPVADVYVICRKVHIVRRTGEMLPKFLRTETPLGRDNLSGIRASIRYLLCVLDFESLSFTIFVFVFRIVDIT